MWNVNNMTCAKNVICTNVKTLEILWTSTKMIIIMVTFHLNLVFHIFLVLVQWWKRKCLILNRSKVLLKISLHKRVFLFLHRMILFKMSMSTSWRRLKRHGSSFNKISKKYLDKPLNFLISYCWKAHKETHKIRIDIYNH